MSIAPLRPTPSSLIRLFLAIAWGMVLAAWPRVASAQPIAVTLDGDPAEWSGTALTAIDPKGDQPGGLIDLQRLRIDSDDRALRFLLEIERETILQNGIAGAAGNDLQLFLDTDDNGTTGLVTHGIGADLVIRFGDQNATWFKTGEVEQLTLNEVGVGYGPTHSGTTFEIEVPFAIRPGLSSTETLVTGSAVNMVWLEEGGDRLPDTGSLRHLLERTPSPPVEPISLERLRPTDVRLLSWNVERDSPLANPLPFRRVIAALDPDIVAFQEIYDMKTDAAVQLVEDALGEPGLWDARRRNDCITASRLPIITSAYSNGNLATRIDLPDAEFGAANLVVFNVHTPCCSNDAGRDFEHDSLAAAWRDTMNSSWFIDDAENDGAIFCGDFNMVGYARQLTTIRDGQLIDNDEFGADFAPARTAGSLVAVPLRATHSRSIATWRGPFGSFVPGRLDWIFATGDVLALQRSFILDAANMPADVRAQWGLMAGDSDHADHLPTVADFAAARDAGVVVR